MEIRNDLDQNVGTIIFISKKMLEKMTIMEKYQKKTITYKLSNKPNLKPKIRIQHINLNKSM